MTPSLVTSMLKAVTCSAVLSVFANPLPLDAQSLDRRIAALADGSAEFTFAARPGVCGDGATFIEDGFGGESRIYEGGNFSGRSRDGSGWPPCVPGPVRVVVSTSGGQPTRIRTYVGPRSSSGSSERTNLGFVSVS